jgi:hypothetical protein
MKFDFDDAYESKESRPNQARPNDWIDATDSLEAVEAIRGWKNFIFTITLIAMFVVQIVFWLANTGIIFTTAGTQIPFAVTQAYNPSGQPVADFAAPKTEPNLSVIERHHNLKNMLGLLREIDRGNLSLFITFVNSVLILGAILYCLILLASLQIAISGRLGGINHISRGFFLSLIFVVLLLPWQKIFAGLVVGAVYSPQELLTSCLTVQSGDTVDQILHYLRFFVLWLVEMCLLIFAQVRSMRWAKAILRRLDVI